MKNNKTHCSFNFNKDVVRVIGAWFLTWSPIRLFSDELGLCAMEEEIGLKPVGLLPGEWPRYKYLLFLNYYFQLIIDTSCL